MIILKNCVAAGKELRLCIVPLDSRKSADGHELKKPFVIGAWNFDGERCLAHETAIEFDSCSGWLRNDPHILVTELRWWWGWRLRWSGGVNRLGTDYRL